MIRKDGLYYDAETYHNLKNIYTIVPSLITSDGKLCSAYIADHEQSGKLKLTGYDFVNKNICDFLLFIIACDKFQKVCPLAVIFGGKPNLSEIRRDRKFSFTRCKFSSA